MPHIWPYLQKMLHYAGRCVCRPERGAANSAYCAVHPEAVQLSGKFLMDCKPTQAPPVVESEEQQDRLWDMTVKLLDIHAKGEQSSSGPTVETT